MMRSRKYNFFVGIGITFYILIFSAISFLKYRAFSYFDFDLAAHAQTLWSIIHGSLYCSILGLDFLGNHAHFILFLIAPLYAFFPHPLTLLFLQSLVLGVSVLPLYLIAREQLGSSLGWLVALMYLIYPALGHTNLFEFHPTIFATLFLMLMYYFFYKNNFAWFVVFTVLSLLCQENIALAVFMFGLLAIFIKKDKRFILTPILLSIFWFFMCFYLIIPYFNHGQMQLFSFYSHLGGNFKEVVLSFVFKPRIVWPLVFNKRSLIFMLQLFAPLSLIPFIGLEFLLIILPFVFQHLLSLRLSEQQIFFHYTAEMIPFIFLGLVYGIKRLMRKNMISSFLKVMMVIFSIFYALYLGPLGYLMIDPRELKVNRLDIIRKNFAEKIPQGVGAIATFEFLPRLANRRFLFSFHNLTVGYYPYSLRRFIMPNEVEYALVDFTDPATKHFISLQKAASVENMLAFINNPQWGIVEIADTITLFKKGYKSQISLFKLLKKEPKGIYPTKVIVKDAIELLGYRFKSNFSYDFSAVFYWRCLNETSNEINIYFDVIDSRGGIVLTLVREICYGVFPTSSWKKGQIIEEDRNFILHKALPKERYVIKLGFYGGRDKRGIQPSASQEGILDKMGRIKIGEITVN